MKACQLLDKAELLFPWQQQQNKEKRKQMDSDDSDEDLLDETGQVEAKKAKREAIKSLNKEKPVAETFESLNERWKKISNELQSIKAKMVLMNKPDERKNDAVGISQDTSQDSLEKFMSDIKTDQQKKDLLYSSIQSKIQKSKLKIKVSELEKEQKRVERLIKIAKPSFNFPQLKMDEKCSQLKNKKSHLTSKFLLTSSIKNKTPNKERNGKNKDLINVHEISQESHNSKNIHENIENNAISDTKPECSTTKFAFKQQQKPLHKNVSEIFNEEIDEIGFKRPSGLIIKKSPSQSTSEKQGVAHTLRKERRKAQAFDLNEENYVDWLPPVNQKGDGKTKLNEKLGY